jgi:hypothetical protein
VGGFEAIVFGEEEVEEARRVEELRTVEKLRPVEELVYI